MKFLKNIVTLLSLVLLGIGMSNSVTIVSGNTEGWDANLAFVFRLGGAGDQSFNDVANAGLFEARIAYNLTVLALEPNDVPAISTILESLAQDSEKDLIIALGSSSEDGVRSAASGHPERNFLIIDSIVDLPNVASFTFREQEGSFLAGVMAALTTSSNKLGFLGGLNISLIHKFGSGFEQGARWINPNIDVTWVYSPDTTNPWNDVNGGRTLAQSLIDTGVDIIFTAAGYTGFGVFDAAEDATNAGTKTYAIGSDSNQDHWREGIVLTSMQKRVDVVVKSQIDTIINRTWAGGVHSLGLAEGSVGITPMEFTQTEANSACGSTTRLSYVNSLIPFIISGGISIEEGIQAPGNFNTIDRSNCPEIIEVTAIITETSTQTETLTSVSTLVYTSTTSISPGEATTTKTVELTKTFSETKSEVGISASIMSGIIFLLVFTIVLRGRN